MCKWTKKKKNGKQRNWMKKEKKKGKAIEWMKPICKCM